MNHYRKAIQYVRAYKTWSGACEAYALEKIEKFRCSICQASEEISMQIYDLMEEYGEENDLPENWWLEYGDEDDVFFEL